MHSRLKRMATILIFALSSTQLIAVGDPTVKGSLPRGTTSSSVTLSVVVTGITNTALLTDEKLLAQRMRIWFTDISTSPDAYIRIQGDTTTPADAKFYLASVSEPISSTTAGTALTTFTYTLSTDALNVPDPLSGCPLAVIFLILSELSDNFSTP